MATRPFVIRTLSAAATQQDGQELHEAGISPSRFISALLSM